LISFDSKHNIPSNNAIDVQGNIDTSAPVSIPSEREDAETLHIIRKIDIRLLPTLAVIYAFALIDRVNLPNARIAGMDTDLKLSIENRYSILTMIFFIPYILFQFPANIIIRHLGPAVWLPSLVIC
jgi:hypothetical protein